MFHSAFVAALVLACAVDAVKIRSHTALSLGRRSSTCSCVPDDVAWAAPTRTDKRIVYFDLGANNGGTMSLDALNNSLSIFEYMAGKERLAKLCPNCIAG